MRNTAGFVARIRARAFLYLFFLVFAIWMCLISTFRWAELTVGLMVSVLLAFFLSDSYSRIGLPPFNLRRLLAFIRYLGVLLKEIIKANFDVAYRVIHPSMPIRPGIVTVRTSLKQDAAKLMLANSITLTPGTFTLDVIGDRLLIHWINVRAEGMEEATRTIAEKFEKHLREVFA